MTAEDPAMLRAARQEQRRLLMPMVPGLVLVCALIVLPMLVLMWQSFMDQSGHFTLAHYLKLAEPLYYQTFFRTFLIAIIVTGVAALLAYPLAYLLAHSTPRTTALLLTMVILPYWTSVLVRTYAWVALLQRRGIINSFLLDIGLIDQPLPLLNNMFGTVVGMVHIMLPLMVLPLYATMRAIDPTLVKAALVCGASPRRAFFDVYFPRSLPGLFSGCVLVFVLALGYYVIPALLGGGNVLMWAMQIEGAMANSPTIGPASALGVMLLVATLAVIGLFGRWLKLGI